MKIAKEIPLENLPTKMLLKSLAQDGQDLLLNEVRLMKAELKEEAQKAAAGAGMLAGGALLANTALLVCAVAVILLLAETMATWAAALLTGGVLLVMGALLAVAGIQVLKKVDLTPDDAIDSLKEDAQCAKQTLRDMQSRREEAT
jgi:uncharacterized membrane protein YqjE